MCVDSLLACRCDELLPPPFHTHPTHTPTHTHAQVGLTLADFAAEFGFPLSQQHQQRLTLVHQEFLLAILRTFTFDDAGFQGSAADHHHHHNSTYGTSLSGGSSSSASGGSGSSGSSGGSSVLNSLSPSPLGSTAFADVVDNAHSTVATTDATPGVRQQQQQQQQQQQHDKPVARAHPNANNSSVVVRGAGGGRTTAGAAPVLVPAGCSRTRPLIKHAVQVRSASGSPASSLSLIHI